MPFVEHDADRVYYELHGEGPAVAFIHGSGGHHAAWWQQVPHFRERHSTITLDLPGFGKSTGGEDFDTLRFPGHILAVLEDAAVGPAVLVGQSIGASAALKAALQRPELVAGVVLAHSLGGIADEELGALVKADRAKAEKLPVLDRLMSKQFQQDSPELTFLFRQMGTFNVAKMADLRNLSAGGPRLEEVREAGVAICFLAGENDAVLRPDTVRRAHELLPDSVLEIVPGAPHSMYWETPQLFNAAVDRFLVRVHSAAAAGSGAN